MQRTIGLCIIIALGVTACATKEDAGQIDLALTGTSASGTTYRLRDAVLTITGDIAPIVFHTEDDPDRTLITQQLDVGAYSLQLTPGWRLERLGAGGVAQTVVATLVSPDPQPFTVVANTFTPVVLRFSTNGEVVVLDRGDIGISIDVEDLFASCAAIRAANPTAADGVYTINPGTGAIQVFCDMTHGGITYEQLAFGNSFASYPGYSLIASSELNDAVIQQAFTALFNLQGAAMINIDTAFTSSNCCIKSADSGPGNYLQLGGHFIFPASVDNLTQCLTSYPDPSYRFVFGDTLEVSPTPLPADFLAAHPATTGPACSDANNPGWFFKRSAASAFTIGGTVSGLTGAGLVLQDNGGDDLAIAADGAFTFPTPVASGATYTVTVKEAPAGQMCLVTAGTGTVATSNVTDVQVTCIGGGWSTSLFPILVPGSQFGFGDLALDNHNDLLVVSNPARAIVRINQLTGAQTTIATGIGTSGFLLGVAYRATNDTIYANTDDGLIVAVAATGAVTPLVAINNLSAIAIAPPGFGGFGGFIIGVTRVGTVVAVNPDTGEVTGITSAAPPASDLAFAPDGTLYICGDLTVSTVTASGVVTPFASGFGSADGIAITPDGGRMFIADSGTDNITQLTLPGGGVTPFASADIDDGFFVSGILVAPGNTLIVMTRETVQILIAFSI